MATVIRSVMSVMGSDLVIWTRAWRQRHMHSPPEAEAVASQSAAGGGGGCGNGGSDE